MNPMVNPMVPPNADNDLSESGVCEGLMLIADRLDVRFAEYTAIVGFEDLISSH